MTTHPRAAARRFAILAGLAYVVVGVVTAELAGAAGSARGRTAWRLAAWLLSLAVFIGHIMYDRGGERSAGRTALHVAAAVALGAFGLALAGPVRSHWGAADFSRAVVLSVVVWPILTGIPAFVVALAAASLLRRQGPAKNGSI